MGGRHVIAWAALVFGVSAQAQQRGVPQNGFPMWQERMLQVLFNRARAAPTVDPKACAETVIRSPLAWQYNFGRSARFHSSNLSRTGCFQHNSPCLLHTDISSRFPPLGTCDGTAACACTNGAVCNAACTSAECTQTFTRISYFGSSAGGEIIAGGYGSPRAAHTGWMNSSGHCSIILSSSGSVGTGWLNNTWTGNFGSGSASGTLIAGGHEVGSGFGQFLTSTAQDVGFRVNYFNAGGAPQSAQLNLDGTCHGMALERGSATNGTYLTTLSLASGTCRRYVFTFVDAGGNTVLLPEVGSYGIGTSSCAEWDVATPSGCGVSDPPPTVVTPAAAAPNPVDAQSTVLSVLGADNGGEGALVYTWSSTGPATPSYSVNGTNAAKTTTATFTRAGSYVFSVNIRDANGQSVASTVAVTVSQTLTSVVVSPATAMVLVAGTQTFTGAGRDQFNQVFSPLPAATWAVSGGGTITAAGVFTAGSTAGGPHVVTATVASVSGTAAVTVSIGQPPTVATPAAASPNPTNSTTTGLSVLGADDGGEASLTYSWQATSGPAGVTFSPTGSNSARNSTATFSRAGTYTLVVTITDGTAQSTISSVTVTVSQSATAVRVTPSNAAIQPSGTQQFAARLEDQFGEAMASQPSSFNWSVSGGGSVSNLGLFTAAAVPSGPFTVSASAQGRTGAALITIAGGSAPTVAVPANAAPSPVALTTTQLSVLGADDGTEASLVYTWTSTGPASVAFAPNGTNAAKSAQATFTRAGSYTFTATIRDAVGLAVASAVTVVVNQTLTTLSASPSAATVSLGGTQQFIASARDQFNDAISPTPALTWTVSGGGSVSGSGLFSAGTTAGGPHTLTLVSGSVTGTASITVSAGSPPAITSSAAANPEPVPDTTTQLSVSASDDLGEASLSYGWAANGPAAVTFSRNNTNAAKSSTATFRRAGSYVLTVTVTDGGGLTASSSLTVTVLATPTHVVVSPGSVNVGAGGTQAFTATTSDQFAQVIASAPSPVWTVSGGGTIDASGLFTASGVASGPHQVGASVGGRTGTATVTVVVGGVDTAPPSVTLLAPTPGATLSARVTFSAQATDNVGVTRVEFEIDRVLVGTVGSPPFEFSLNTGLLTNGAHTVAALASDAAGNVGRSALVSVTVSNDGVAADVTPPTVVILSPREGDSVSGTVQVRADATDENGVASVRFLLDGNEVASASAEPFTARIDLTDVSLGSHSLGVTAVDPAGNVGRSNSIAVTVRAVGPVRGTCGCSSEGAGTLVFGLGLVAFEWRRRRGRTWRRSWPL